MTVLEGLVRDGAGRSAERRYRELSKPWRRRFFGRRTIAYAWIVVGLLLVLLVTLHPPEGLAIGGGLFLGGCVVAIELLPDVFVPSHIFNWQRGAWAEQNTASELRRLSRGGWVVRHDVRWGDRANHDHVVANGAVFVLNSKNVKDSRIEVEEHGLRIERLEDPSSSYLADRWLPQAANEARSLRGQLTRRAGTPAHVYPVIVVWGKYDEGAAWVGDVAVVRGDLLAGWLESCPVDLLNAERRGRVLEAVRSLPAAT